MLAVDEEWSDGEFLAIGMEQLESKAFVVVQEINRDLRLVLALFHHVKLLL